ncbi:Nuclear fragile X mental retardation-interacting protein 1 [Mycena sanguinolenta]|uniref:Nuclear fragile X mental retardation-interacting protein 1 n=1 Tax=Mycena sanguinolenta TaxID=230812 RepID=A0A8H6XFF4_9AGAR|nr:Nuclear fragile X mental retardation-interacting protein 1 [Mycena sanguinolenta]
MPRHIQQHAAATPQGYTYSSTYNPAGPSNAPKPSTFSAPWYQPGNSRCTYKNCTFRGSPQTVETHMMDRHLIFPPGWEKRKKKPEWDADPSLKGKTIPIQGTTVVLDSPEQLEAWIAERKKRWPSAQRVEEKKRKMEEAVARGQLSLEDSGLAGRKRRRIDDGNANSDRGRGRGRGAARGARGRGRGLDSGWRGRGRGGVAQQQTRPPPPASESSSSSDDSDDDGAPEEIESTKIEPPAVVAPPVVQVPNRPRPPQPKQPIRNPFASRPTLLRNFSNLSQAIRFLVDNDFLQNVELKPGQANEKLIEVLPEDEGLINQK